LILQLFLIVTDRKIYIKNIQRLRRITLKLASHHYFYFVIY
jgi:hypothetical protein